MCVCVCDCTCLLRWEGYWWGGGGGGAVIKFHINFISHGSIHEESDHVRAVCEIIFATRFAIEFDSLVDILVDGYCCSSG